MLKCICLMRRMCWYCCVLEQDHTAPYIKSASLPCRIFAHVSIEEIWTTCWLHDTHSHKHTCFLAHTLLFRKLLLFVNEAKGAEARDKNMWRHAKIKSLHAQACTALLHAHLYATLLLTEVIGAVYSHEHTFTHRPNMQVNIWQKGEV